MLVENIVFNITINWLMQLAKMWCNIVTNCIVLAETCYKNAILTIIQKMLHKIEKYALNWHIGLYIQKSTAIAVTWLP